MGRVSGVLCDMMKWDGGLPNYDYYMLNEYTLIPVTAYAISIIHLSKLTLVPWRSFDKEIGRRFLATKAD